MPLPLDYRLPELSGREPTPCAVKTAGIRHARGAGRVRR
jgi:hypothetical protein